jgi:hypothetical protein
VAWKSLKNVTTNSLGNHKAENCCDVVADLVQSLQSCEVYYAFNPLNAELNPICHLVALLGGATIVVVSRVRVKGVFLRLSLRQVPINLGAD